MNRVVAFALTAAAVLTAPITVAQDWKMQPLVVQTRWAELVSPSNALPEYPRPQLVRGNWHNLNGLWSYAITSSGAAKPSRYDGDILVPYPLESALSGVQKSLRPDQLLWYRRSISVPVDKNGGRTLLHFGAVDYRATVYVNDREIGTHSGGYQSFTFDITNALTSGDNELVVKVFDPTDVGPNPHGKQTLYPQGSNYTSTSGIWQTVWLEAVPQSYIESVVTTPDVDRSDLRLEVKVNNLDDRDSVQATVRSGQVTIATQTVPGTAVVHIERPRLWSPDDPFLYDLQVRLLRNGAVVDEVTSYFGLREIKIKKDAGGLERIFLNGKLTYNLGVLDQGFWPEGIYTAPTDAALKFDIQAAKAMGFNTIRKHIKVEPDRWYYYCDKLGMLVWQDMVPPANDTSEARAEFERESAENLAQLHNHPSITTWVLFNEGSGGYDQKRLARWIKGLDPSRLVNAHSGPNVEHIAEWKRNLNPATLSRLMSGDSSPLLKEVRTGGFKNPANWVGSDLTDIHIYPDPVIPPSEGGRARVVGEHGGVALPIDGHTWNGVAGWGYTKVTSTQMAGTYRGMVDKLKRLEARGLSGSIYTQPYDVEGEQNGLMTYDRAVIKIPVESLQRINGEIVPTALNYIAATRGFSIDDPDPRPEALRYRMLVAQYNSGNRDPMFLRHLTTMAIQQGDQAQATSVGNALIDLLSQPYPRDVWAFMQAVTRTSQDKGFEIFQTQAARADAILGEGAAEVVVRQVIAREEIEPHLSHKGRAPDWAAIEKRAADKYGVLGAEEVYGTEMIQSLNKQNWERFAKYYVLYFKTAVSRSEYPMTDLSYALLQHVSDATVLETATEVCRAYLDAREIRGENDPTDIDTYASLLYKTGREHEAIEWEQKAEDLSQGRDSTVADNLAKMRARRSTGLAQVH